ncbi:hypothetical protein GCM10023306_15900 [Novosphingobium ginsenosidimutans]
MRHQHLGVRQLAGIEVAVLDESGDTVETGRIESHSVIPMAVFGNPIAASARPKQRMCDARFTAAIPAAIG